MLALLCSLDIRAVNSSETRAARTPGNLLATIDMPIPVPQIRIPFSASLGEIGPGNLFAEIRIVDRIVCSSSPGP